MTERLDESPWASNEVVMSDDLIPEHFSSIHIWADTRDLLLLVTFVSKLRYFSEIPLFGLHSGEKAELSFRGQHTISSLHRAAGKFCLRCPLLAQSWSVYLILLRGGTWNSVSHRMKWLIEVFQPVTSDSFRIMMGYKLRLKHFWIKRKGRNAGACPHQGSRNSRIETSTHSSEADKPLLTPISL